MYVHLYKYKTNKAAKTERKRCGNLVTRIVGEVYFISMVTGGLLPETSLLLSFTMEQQQERKDKAGKITKSISRQLYANANDYCITLYTNNTHIV